MPAPRLFNLGETETPQTRQVSHRGTCWTSTDTHMAGRERGSEVFY